MSQLPRQLGTAHCTNRLPIDQPPHHALRMLRRRMHISIRLARPLHLERRVPPQAHLARPTARYACRTERARTLRAASSSATGAKAGSDTPQAGTTTRLVNFNGGQGTINVNSWAPDSRRFAYVAYPIRA